MMQTCTTRYGEALASMIETKSGKEVLDSTLCSGALGGKVRCCKVSEEESLLDTVSEQLPAKLSGFWIRSTMVEQAPGGP